MAPRDPAHRSDLAGGEDCTRVCGYNTPFPVILRGNFRTETRCDKYENAYLETFRCIPHFRKRCPTATLRTTSAEARPVTLMIHSETNLDRMNEQLGNRQHSNIFWHLPHFFAIVLSGSGFHRRASLSIKLGHLIRSFEVPCSPKGPRRPQQTEEERESGREDWEGTQAIQHDE